MRHTSIRLAILTLVTLGMGLWLAPSGGAQDAKEPPDKLVFKAMLGAVTFDHAKHVESAEGDCTTCHEKLWPQDAKAPLNFKEKMHQTAEAGKTSCAACHHADGPSFASKGNCKRCHVKE